MRRLILLCPFLLTLAFAGPPLRITSVERRGEPPYENSERLYRVAGDGLGELKIGSNLDIRRKNERRRLGRLEVVSVGQGFVLTRIAAPGETYPLVGDLVVPRDIRPKALPRIPDLDPNPLPPLTRLAPQEPQASLRLLEPVFFLRGDSALSPGGEQKLESWVQAHGKDGHWFLLWPADPRQREDVVQARCQALKTALEKLGVSAVEIRKGAFDSHEKYDFVRVGREP